MTSRVDLHAHFIPDFYRAALDAAGLSEPDGLRGLPAWTEQTHLDAMDTLHISKSYLSISSPGVNFGDAAKAAELSRRVNEEAVRLREAHPGRFGFFASVPFPDTDAAEAELRYAIDTLDADGLALETHTGDAYLGDERLHGLYSELNRHHSTLFIHPTTPYEAGHLAFGYPQPMLEFIFDTTRSVTNLILSGTLEKFPNMRVIVPHAGAALPILANRVDLLLPLLGQGGATPPSVKQALRRLDFDLAGAPAPELLSALLMVADPDRIHYGSDYPFTPLQACLKLADALDETGVLGYELRDAIYANDITPHVS